MSTHALINIVDALQKKMTKLQSRVDYLESGKLDHSESMSRSTICDVELPVHNGKKVNDDLEDVLNSTVQRVDYLESNLRDSKKSVEQLNDNIRSSSSQPLSNIEMSSSFNNKQQVTLEMFNKIKMDLNKKVNIEDAFQNDDISSVKTSLSNLKMQFAELNGFQKNLQTTVQSISLNQKSFMEDTTYADKIDIVSLRMKSQFDNLQERLLELELSVSNTIVPLQSKMTSIDSFMKQNDKKDKDVSIDDFKNLFNKVLSLQNFVQKLKNEHENNATLDVRLNNIQNEISFMRRFIEREKEEKRKKDEKRRKLDFEKLQKEENEKLQKEENEKLQKEENVKTQKEEIEKTRSENTEKLGAEKNQTEKNEKLKKEIEIKSYKNKKPENINLDFEKVINDDSVSEMLNGLQKCENDTFENFDYFNELQENTKLTKPNKPNKSIIGNADQNNNNNIDSNPKKKLTRKRK
jgi:reticulocyte-binding protein